MHNTALMDVSDNAALEMPQRLLIPVRRLKQVGPACGTTALAMACNALLAQQGKPGTYTQAALDQGNRLPFMFSSPTMLLRIAREQGFFAKACNNLSTHHIKAHLRQGHLLLPLGMLPFDLGRLRTEPFSWHWTLLHGYDDSFEPEHPLYAELAGSLHRYSYLRGKPVFLVSDPNDFSYVVSAESLFCTVLKRLHCFALPTNVSGFGLIISSRDALAPATSIPFLLRSLHAMARLIQALALPYSR